MATKTKSNVTEIPTYLSARLGQKFRDMVLRRQKLKAMADKAEEELGNSHDPRLNAEIELALAERDLRSVIVDKYQVTIAEGSNSNLSKELLLEAGVDADTLEACTVSKKYTYILVTEVKANKARGEKLAAKGIAVVSQGPKLKKSTKARVLRKQHAAVADRKAARRSA